MGFSVSGTTCPAPCALAVTLDLAAPLPVNYPDTAPPLVLSPTSICAGACVHLGTVVSYSFTDGSATQTRNDKYFNDNVFVIFQTGSQGQPTEWYVYTTDLVPVDPQHRVGLDMLTVRDTTAKGPDAPLFTGDSTFQSGYSAYNQNNAGTWSVKTVPEPSALFVLATGILCLVGMTFRRRLA